MVGSGLLGGGWARGGGGVRVLGLVRVGCLVSREAWGDLRLGAGRLAMGARGRGGRMGQAALGALNLAPIGGRGGC